MPFCLARALAYPVLAPARRSNDRVSEVPAEA
jgi:hypothetical protein